ncbi:MAG: response regulator transcription factor [Anaerolineae bacterium]|nr:response regulator transcription factor [Anaerolineae bacterium]
MAHILAVDDDRVVQLAIRYTLQNDGHTVSVANNGQQALEKILHLRPDLVILDIMMPDIDGLEVCRRIRSNPFMSKLPVIFLTSKSRPIDRVQGLDAGSDDFLPKSAVSVELLARVRALLRRTTSDEQDIEPQSVCIGGVCLRITRPEVKIGEYIISLTPLEHRLLGYLMAHAGQPVSVAQLLENVWDYPGGMGDNEIVRVAINRLRAKLEPRLTLSPYIRTVRGHGYMIAD